MARPNPSGHQAIRAMRLCAVYRSLAPGPGLSTAYIGRWKVRAERKRVSGREQAAVRQVGRDKGVMIHKKYCDKVKLQVN